MLLFVCMINTSSILIYLSNKIYLQNIILYTLYDDMNYYMIVTPFKICKKSVIFKFAWRIELSDTSRNNF